MRLTRVTVQAFRGFGKEQKFDLDAPFVLLVGPNGRGKTSFVDAVQWALSGKITRLTGSRDAQGNDYITNAFVAGPPQVELTFAHGDETVVVTRSGQRGEHFQVQRRTGERTQEWQGQEAESQLMQLLALRPLAPTDLYGHLIRTHLLEQETLVEFLRAETPADRFRQLSRLLGLDEIARRGQTLREAARRAEEEWTTGELELQGMQRRRTELLRMAEGERRLAQRVADAAQRQQLLAAAQEALREVASLTEIRPDLPSDLDALESACQRGIAALDAAGRRWVQRRAALTALQQRSQELAQMAADRQTLQANLQAVALVLADMQRRLDAAREAEAAASRAASQAAEAVRQAAGLRQTWVQFFSLGKELAHGQNRCPLCHQPIEANALAAHIDAEMARLGDGLQAVTNRQAEAQAAWREAQAELARLEAEWAQARRQQQDLQQQLLRLSEQGLQTELTHLGIEVTDPATLGEAIDRHLQSVTSAIGRAAALRTRLTEIAAAADAIGRSQRLGLLEAQIRELDGQIEAATETQQQRARRQQRLADLAKRVRAVESGLVQDLLRRCEATWQEFYYRIQPHPLFSRLTLEFGNPAGEQREVYFRAEPEGEGSPRRANMIFSAAQMAALAVVLFFALHLHQNWSSLETILLDDPMQNMDDISVLGLVDLLRYFIPRRQIILTTHSTRYTNMLLQKFHASAPEQPALLYTFAGWSRLGPVILADRLAPQGEPQPLLLAQL